MSKKVTPRDILIYTITISGIMISLIDVTYKFVDIGYNFWLTSGVVTGTVIYFFIIHKVKYAWTSLVLIFLLPKPLYIIKFLKSFIMEFDGFLGSLIVNQYVAKEYYNYFHNLIYIAIPIVALIIYFLVVKKKAVPLLVFGGALISIYYFLGLENIGAQCSYFLIFSFILYSYNNYSLKWNKWDTKNIRLGKGYYAKVMGINLVFILLVNFAVKPLPMNREPLSFEWFESNFANRFDEVQGREDVVLSDASYKSKFSLSSTGYQQDATRLGGPIEDNNTLAIRVKSTDDIDKIHLRGTVKDLYNGFMWDKSDKLTLKFHNTLLVPDYDLPYEYKEIEIIHQGMMTSTAFNALYPSVLDNNYKYAFVDSDFQTYNPRLLRPGKGYKVKFKDFMIDQDTMVEKSKITFTEYPPELKKYLQLPEELPIRVVDLTNNITAKYTSPYMKVSAIEDYLKTHFPYSKNTSYLPEGRDFVDYFLFDEKKGSCTYYASALAVMARIVNVPSRYVEGFVVPYTTAADGYKDILNSDAHAWVELYFEGIGWVTFDPTPGSQSLAYQFSKTDDSTTDTNVNTDNQNSETGSGADSIQKPEKDIEEIDGAAGVVQSENRWIYVTLYTVGGILGTGLLLFIISLIIYFLINLSIRKNKQIVDISKHKMLMFGDIAGVPYTKGETLREYLKGLSRRLEMNVDNYTLIYEKALYANHALNEDERKTILDTMLDARKKIMNYSSLPKFLAADYMNTIKFYIKKLKKSK